jgi:O-antigen/teichoic acid export membrane protein
MRSGVNLLAGLANSIWSALVGIFMVPLYLRYLGIESYGLIGVFITTQALLQLLDMGMTPTINREVARSSAEGDLNEVGGLLHTLAVVYWVVAGLIAVLIWALAPFIAEDWLQSRHLSSLTMTHAVMLIGLLVACRWPIGLYQGVLVGAQRLAIASAINMVMVTIGGVGAIVILAFVSPTIEAFFVWQACIGLISVLSMRVAAWKIIGITGKRGFDTEKLKSVWRFTAGMGGVGLTALAFTQLDKIILSRMLGLEGFGHYMLATTVVSGLYVLISPLFNVIYPRFSLLVATGETEKLIGLYRLGTRAFVALLFPIAMVLAFFAGDLVQLWTRDASIAVSVAPVITLLVIGSTLNGVMYFPYALQLAYGMTWIPLVINLALMLFLVPSIIFLANEYGAQGGGMAWMLVEVAYVLLGTVLTHRYILKGLASTWLLQDVCPSLLLTLAFGAIGHTAIYAGSFSSFGRVICAGGLALFTVVVLFLMSKQLRSLVFACVVNRNVEIA